MIKADGQKSEEWARVSCSLQNAKTLNKVSSVILRAQKVQGRDYTWDQLWNMIE